MTINKTIAETLGMEVPEEVQEDHSLVEVAPHEMPVPVENPNLPDMTDTDHRMAEGEAQLEKLIKAGMNTFTDLDEKRHEIEPKYLSRHIETSSQMFGMTLDAIKHKTELQIKKKKARLEEAEFTGPGDGGPNTQNNIFVGSREDLMNLLEEGAKTQAAPEDVHDVEDASETDSE